MGVNPSCLEVDLSKLAFHIVGSIVDRFVDPIPCVQSASAGIQLGALNLPPLQGSSVIVSCSAGSRLLIDEGSYQLVRRLLVGTTAGSFRVMVGSEEIDARAHLASQWTTKAGVHRSNSTLRVSRLVTIKSAFGLSNSDLARICRISRPQLYKWLSSDQAVELSPLNWKRLSELALLAKEWNRISTQPLRLFLEIRISRKSRILDLLSASRLNVSAIRNAMNHLASQTGSIPTTREDRLSAAGIKPRRPAGTLPWDD